MAGWALLLCVVVVGGAVALACGPLDTRNCPASETVNTKQGPVVGFKRSWGLDKPVEIFHGIPFALPPVGELRFRSPHPVNYTWTTPLEARKVPPMCPQLRTVDASKVLFGGEDCLYVNVYKPEGDVSGLPVFLWIYGGGYVVGDGWEFGAYDGSHLASKYNIIVVSMNYRLGALGFFALDSLRHEDENGSTGNYAVQDQRMAMQWTQDNIAAFGGDPKRVTLAGESAGGFSVTYHLVSAASSGLFSAAIVQSGTNEVDWFFQPYDNARAMYNYTAAYLGCPVNETSHLDCLRQVSYEKFVISFTEIFEDGIKRHDDSHHLPDNIPNFGSPLYPLMPNGPVIDGSEQGLMDVPYNLVKAGKYNKVPLLLGANKNGGTIFEPSALLLVPHYTVPATEEGVANALEWFLVDNATIAEAEVMYPKSEFTVEGVLQNDARISHLIRDMAFQCSNRRLATAYASAGLITYLYTFSFDLGEIDKLSHLGDFHASELVFVFGTFMEEVGLIVPHAQEISDLVSSRWANFVTCHNPNGCADSPEEALKDVAEWPQFTVATRDQKGSGLVRQLLPAEDDTTRQYYSLQLPPIVARIRADNKHPDDEFPSDEKCDFMDTLKLPWHSLRDFMG